MADHHEEGNPRSEQGRYILQGDSPHTDNMVRRPMYQLICHQTRCPYVHPGLTYFLSNYAPPFNLCDKCISAGDRLRDRRPETWIARRKSCSLARVKGVAAAPGCSRTPVFSNGPYRVTPHLTSQS